MLLLFRGVSQRDTVHGSNDNIHGYRSVNTLPSVYAASDLSFTFPPPPLPSTYVAYKTVFTI